MRTYREWHGAPSTIDDLRTMSIGEAAAIYSKVYAEHIDFAKLPNGLDYCVLDAAVNEGIGAALIFLALALDVAPYLGTSDPYTFATALANVKLINFTTLKARMLLAVPTAKLTTVINWICDNRLVEKMKRPEWPRFGLGWTNRIEYVRKNSLAMVGT